MVVARVFPHLSRLGRFREFSLQLCENLIDVFREAPLFLRSPLRLFSSDIAFSFYEARQLALSFYTHGPALALYLQQSPNCKVLFSYVTGGRREPFPLLILSDAPSLLEGQSVRRYGRPLWLLEKYVPGISGTPPPLISYIY